MPQKDAFNQSIVDLALNKIHQRSRGREIIPNSLVRRNFESISVSDCVSVSDKTIKIRSMRFHVCIVEAEAEE